MNTHFLLIRFEIPNNKIQEFDIAFQRLVKWPVYTLYTVGQKGDHKTFELTRNWDSYKDMREELGSQQFVNMIGMIKVLGNILESQVYDISKEENLFEMNNSITELP